MKITKRRGKNLCRRLAATLDDMHSYAYTRKIPVSGAEPYHYWQAKAHWEGGSLFPDECEQCHIVQTIRYLNDLASDKTVGRQALEFLRRWILPEEYILLKACYKGKFS